MASNEDSWSRPGLWAWNGNREYAFGEPAKVKLNDWTPLKVREVRQVQK